MTVCCPTSSCQVSTFGLNSLLEKAAAAVDPNDGGKFKFCLDIKTSKRKLKRKVGDFGIRLRWVVILKARLGLLYGSFSNSLGNSRAIHSSLFPASFRKGIRIYFVCYGETEVSGRTDLIIYIKGPWEIDLQLKSFRSEVF